MVQLEWVDVEFAGFFSLPNLHPLTLMVKKLGSPCQDMKPSPQGVRSLAKLGSPCQDMKPGPQGVQSLAKLGSLHQDMNPCPQGVRSLANLGSLCQDMKPDPQGLPRPAKVGSLCQDMKPCPRGLAFRKNLDLRVRTWNPVHRANWCTTISTTDPIYAKSSDFYAKLNVSNLNVTNLY